MSEDRHLIAYTNDMIAEIDKKVRRGLSDAEEMHLTQLEIRIGDHRTRMTESLLEIGRCLNDAKDAQLVPHGYWQDWVAAHTGFTIRGAQRVMRAAREVASGSPLARLDFGKVSALLALPAEEREDFAREADAEGATLRELQAAIREKKELESRLEQQRREMEADAYALRIECDREREHREEAVRAAKEMKRALDDRPVHTVETLVMPADYEDLKRRDAEADARIREAEEYAVSQEERVRELETRLAAAPDMHAESDAERIIRACSAFYAEVCRCDTGSVSGVDAGALRTWAGMVSRWADDVMARLGTGGSVEVDCHVR